MAQKIIELECPGCAAALSMDMKICPKCYRPIIISSLNTIREFTTMDLKKHTNTYNKAMAANPDSYELNMSLAFCYLKLKLYDKAIPCFEKALEENFDNADAYFYAAIALLKGKDAFLASRKIINKIIEYIEAANMIEAKGIYYYFLAYIKFGYFERKSLKNHPTYKECLLESVNSGLTHTDIHELYELLGVDIPAELSF